MVPLPVTDGLTLTSILMDEVILLLWCSSAAIQHQGGNLNAEVNQKIMSLKTPGNSLPSTKKWVGGHGTI